jgi:hypothetical protein
METQPFGERPRPRIGAGLVLVLGAIALPTLLIIGITGYFRLGSDTAALRDGVLEVMPGTHDARGTLNVGPITLGLARLGIGMIDDIPADARQAISSVHSVEGAVYHINNWVEPAARARIATETRKVMRKRGWDPLVMVQKGEDLVQVFFKEKTMFRRQLRLCVLVLHEEELVIASVRGDITPLIDLATKHLELEGKLPLFAHR